MELAKLTEKYGGLRQVKKTDTQYKNDSSQKHHQGGDKFNTHDYLSVYQSFLPTNKDTKILEIGILEGISIAVWSDCYPEGQVDGVDIDLTHYENHLPTMLESGAFTNKNYSVKIANSLDQKDVDDYMKDKQLYDVIIDDGDHRTESIIKTFNNVFKYLQPGGVYFIEDNASINKNMLKLGDKDNFHKHGEMSIIIKETNNKYAFVTSLFALDNMADLPGKFGKIPGWDYLLFTNLNINGSSWDNVKLNTNKFKNIITLSRCPKFQLHNFIDKKYDVIVYCDAYLSPIADKDKWTNIVDIVLKSESGIVQCLHPKRDCAYEECNEIVKAGRDNNENISKTIELLKDNKLPDKYGLWMNTFFAYNPNNDKLIELFNKLWEYLGPEKYTYRDQPLYSLASYLTNIKPDIFDISEMFDRTGKYGVHIYNNRVLNINQAKNMSKINDNYYARCKTGSDINQHLPILSQYASQCESILEAGVRSVISTWSFLHGLSNNKSKNKRLISVDIENCNINNAVLAATEVGIKMTFIQSDILKLQTYENVDLFFIDTFHIYGQLKRELEMFNTKVNKYIIMHDTTVDAIEGEIIRCKGVYNLQKIKQQTGWTEKELLTGLWPAVTEFLELHPEWQLEHRYTNNNGLTVLRRVSSKNQKL